ncbi:hypothetical protein PsYK624_039910 [Phanerochaete sordida]|uniref:Uncharacterized protein n=1 Tax=Phanerochaete sordida TaxID=48140 RepID=A0A9P3G440_9APHY|nr:hypothetical protein PsYK624_039910 [Phanerochaete sordida]
MKRAKQVLQDLFRGSGRSYDLACSYLVILSKLDPRQLSNNKAGYVCAYIASEQLQNSRFTAARALKFGDMRPDAFWKLVVILDDCLGDAAEGSSHAPDRDTFEYERLPRYDPPCKACKEHDYPCLEPSVQGQTRRCDCQACALQHGISCEKEAIRTLEDPEDSDYVESDDESEEESDDDGEEESEDDGEEGSDDDGEESDPGPKVAHSTKLKRLLQRRASTESSDDVPLALPPSSLSKSRIPLARQLESEADTLPGETSSGTGKRARSEFESSDAPDSKRRAIDLTDATPPPPTPATSPPPPIHDVDPNASTPTSPTACSKHTVIKESPEAGDALHDVRMYIKLACELSAKIAQHFEKEGCRDRRLAYYIEEMVGELKPVVDGEPIDRLDCVGVKAAHTRVVTAIHDVATADTSSLDDVTLSVMISKLNKRLGHLLDTSVLLL